MHLHGIPFPALPNLLLTGDLVDRLEFRSQGGDPAGTRRLHRSLQYYDSTGYVLKALPSI